MDLSLDTDQQQLVEVFGQFFDRECPLSRVRDAEPLGFDGALWSQLGALGGAGLGVAGELGGSGASLLDLALVCELLGASLAPVPLIEAVVTARLLAAAGPPAENILDRVVGDTGTIATTALAAAAGGRARLVPAGAVADIVVGLDDDQLVAATASPPMTAPRNLGCAPVADRDLGGGHREVLARGTDASNLHRRALDEWRALMAAALVGVGRRSLELGVAYAKDRQQFGVPIGSFQAIAHRLADVATAVDGALMLSREASWSAAEDPAELPRLAAMAFLFAARTAQEAAAVSLHVHGGYGFSLEYDIQLYFRRAKAWPLALGDPRRGALSLADELFGPVARVGGAS